MKKLAILVAVWLVLPAWSRGEGWSEFRGPTGQGHVLDGALPTTWSKDKNVVWKREIAGNGLSSPVVVGGRVYLTTAVPEGNSKDQSLRALCIDADSGKVLWDKEVFIRRQDGAAIHSKGTTPTPRPSSMATNLCPLRPPGLGMPRSRRQHRLEEHRGLCPVHGNGGSPILTEKAMIFSCDGSVKQFIVALSRADGKVLWKNDRKSTAPKRFSFSTPLLIEVNGKKQVISPASNAVIAYDADNGDEIWRVRYEGYSVIPRPVFGNGLIFLSSSYDSPTLLAIKPDGKGDVTATHIAWSSKKGAPHTPSPLLVGEELYTVSDRGRRHLLERKAGDITGRVRARRYSASPSSPTAGLLQSEKASATSW